MHAQVRPSARVVRVRRVSCRVRCRAVVRVCTGKGVGEADDEHAEVEEEREEAAHDGGLLPAMLGVAAGVGLMGAVIAHSGCAAFTTEDGWRWFIRLCSIAKASASELEKPAEAISIFIRLCGKEMYQRCVQFSTCD